MRRLFRFRRGLIRLVFAAALLVSPQAFAGCSGPPGNAGDIVYSSTSTIMVYCNGTNWIAMGQNAAVSFGTLTNLNFCTATSGTAIQCATPATGSNNVVLSASPTLTGTVAGASSTWSGQVAIGTTATSGALNVSGTVTATTFSGSGASLTGIGTASLSGITGTPSSTTFLAGNGTWEALSTSSLPSLASTDVWVGNGSNVATATATTGTGNVVMSASPTLTGTVTGAASNWSGAVGIGTTSPNWPLTINNGTDRNLGVLTDASYANLGGIMLISANSANSAYKPLSIQASSIVLNSSGGTGNVGIGTTGPASPLQVNGSGGAILIYNPANTQTFLNITGSGTSPVFGTNIGFVGSANDFFTGTSPGDSVVKAFSSDSSKKLFLGANSGSSANLVLLGNGNVGIGMTGPLGILDVTPPTGSDNNWIYMAPNSGGATGKPSSSRKYGLMIGWNSSGGSQETQILQGNGNGGTPVLQIGRWDGTTKNIDMTLSGGNVGINTTSPTAARLVIANNGQNISSISITGYAYGLGYGIVMQQANDSGANPIAFFNAEGAGVGGIVTTGSATAFNTTSDRRLKENIALTSRGLDALATIPVEDFNFIADPKKTRVQGFIAQDLYKIYPEAVTVGGGDPKKQPWSVDYGRLTPLLVKSIQELKAENDNEAAEIKTLRADIEQLKATRH
jgi:hypothetical protein